ncbi:porin family protein [Vibrio crassostreae]|uniref:porin family protein n=1 Tax=Vibrio crassostreae TaxID=246167 RepID=UPI001051CEE7|nr:porin family protein [Vibrio crassostreae]TCN98071.1 opacity protein-like surface antigen [Vibrio crassostreae]CAK1703770.1 Opacity protein-like surface antigen [Vibrio crassostreae]CAK1723258.1 Opacity protein-like surface antigen [Vibrio crassostreae]CAK1778586.1 Opacity protein-like surface antigen [Vibrio crassostreae]CAK1879845.1 Opacity protein-like surface antigen [Vibrio crassostreae]
MNNKFILSIAMMSAVAANNVMAADSGFYLGGAIGTTGIDDGGLYKDSLMPITVDAEDETYKIIAGYQFNRIVALEAQYTNYGDVVAKNALNQSTYTWSPTAFSISANLGYTFDNGIRPFGIIGLSTIDLDQSLPLLDDDSGEGIRYGFGVEYTPKQAKNVSFRLGYEADAFVIESDSAFESDKDLVIDSFYFGATYNF